VAQISRSFDAYWNSEWAVPIGAFLGEPPASAQLQQLLQRMDARAEKFRASDYAETLRATDLGRLLRAGGLALAPARASALYDDPAKPRIATDGTEGTILPVLRGAVEAAQREVILISPYFIPSARGMGVLCGLASRRVRVRVLTNSLASTDVPVVHAGYARYRPRLLACGVELYERRPDGGAARSVRARLSSGASLHAKAAVVDRKWVLLGSMNLDPRSRLSNTEVAVSVESAALGAQLGELFDEAAAPDQAFRVALQRPGNERSPLVWTGEESGKPARFTSEPLAGWWRRFVAALLGTLAPEEML
jgi:putative cardiolipin synthase